MTMYTRRSVLAGAGLAALGARVASARQTDPEEFVRPTPIGPAVPPELDAVSGNWAVAQGNLAAHRAAVGSPFIADRAAQLEVVWEFPVEASTGYGGMTANPIAIDRTVYLQDMRSNVFALERGSGALIWERRYDVPCIGPNGVAIAYGRLFAAAGDTAEVFCLDAVTGQELWRVRLSNNPREGIDMVPAVYDSTVYVSTVAGNTEGFNEAGTKGILYALDAGTGETLWQFDTTTDNLWGNPRVNSGGGLWYPPSFDEEGIYFGVANAAPWPGTEAYPNGSSRPGANDYASSMVALDRATGAVRWHYNAAPHDLLDHDFQNTPILVAVEIDGAARRLAVGSGKTGTVVAIDRDSGAVVWRASVGRHWSDDLAELPAEETEIFPGAWGGVLTPAAYAHGLIFVPLVQQRTLYSATGFNRESMFDFSDASGGVVALDVTSGETVWQAESPSPSVAGATVVNDTVVTGGLDGVLRVYSAQTGELIGAFSADTGINATPAVAGELIILPAAGPNFRRGDAPSTPSGQARPRVVALSGPAQS